MIGAVNIKVMSDKLNNLIEESNSIEGIYSYGREEQYEAYINFLNLDKITIEDIVSFAKRLNETSFTSSSLRVPEFRDKKGMDVTVGKHKPIEGGSHVIDMMKLLLNRINMQNDSMYAFRLHMEYEHIHPLTDGNGRTGRAIWAWLMIKDDYDFGLGFLHKWYYQSLEYYRNLL